MARVGRLAGAIVAHTGSDYFLVGNTKRPCDWEAVGFEPPVGIDATKNPYLRLAPREPVDLPGPWLTVEVEGEELARRLAERLVIARTGSISERLWRLVTGKEDDDGDEVRCDVDARWLVETPMRFWSIVQEAVLRCS
jgi:hypothetical protein